MDAFTTLMAVKKYMNREIELRPGSMNVYEAALLMTENNIDSIVILEEEKVIGIITESDIVRKVVAKKLDPDKMLLNKFMSHPVIEISGEESIFEAKKVMEEHNVKHLLVKEEGKVIGVISAKDMTKT